MNVFEDLIVELKEANLLETTEVEADPPKNANVEVTAHAGFRDDEAERVEIETNASIPDSATGDHHATSTKPAKLGKEFFNKRAVNEVSSHQMVEHVLTGVEREFMKVVPKTFDDLDAKKALHTFLNVPGDPNSEEHKSAEFVLMQETESWSMALIERDNNISVSNIRRYCENSRPALSSQALLALARFYRNAPYSESVRAKFDFVITRLFSRPGELDKRACLFSRDAMLGHIKTLYSEWSSIPLYAAEDDDSNILLTGLSFDDLAAEAESATHFDQLIASDFFGRLRLFKESISELFYAPNVTAAAIDSNIRIGNAYVNLIVRERQKLDAASIQSKYGDFSEQTVSDAAGRTLDLVELLNGINEEALAISEITAEVEFDAPDEIPFVSPSKPQQKASKTDKVDSSFVGRTLDSVRQVNRWLLGFGLVILLLSGGIFFWSSYIVEDRVSSAGVTNVELENTFLKEYITTGRVSGDAFYGLLLPSWDAAPKEKRQEFLQKVYQAGGEKGWRHVNLIGKDGKLAGYASATRLEIMAP